MRRLTTEEFIARANIIHNNKYDYITTKYISSKENLSISCSEHGTFTLRPASHIKGQGCPICGLSRINHKNKLSISNFLEKANLKYNNKYTYNLNNFQDGSSIVKVICPTHGEFECSANRHLDRRGCKECIAGGRIYGREKGGGETRTPEKIAEVKKKYFEFVKEVHNNRYTYNEDSYITNKSKITIICPIHGEFQQQANNHRRSGCFNCAKVQNGIDSRLSNDNVIERIKIVHGDKYDLSKVNYIQAGIKIEIGCKEHGFIKNTFSNILNTEECCPKCLKRKSFTRTSFNEFLKGRKAYVYLIKLTSEYECFYKIGITVNIDTRFTDFKHFYKVELIDTIESYDGVFIYDKETELHRRYKHLKYKPQSIFGGYTECFELSNEILNTFKQ